ncbi:MAG: hypothetical protein QGG67_08460 [Gammaproteobacteria bacterium]|nr:hypothetical protein [Gammaproteobacteria bacterium]MDP6096000.1 hypothetical protein [Gammaproteobacteria bacterium]HJO10807.1 hypothetical protein [Gammaproteobacteria bacterium]
MQTLGQFSVQFNNRGRRGRTLDTARNRLLIIKGNDRGDFAIPTNNTQLVQAILVDNWFAELRRLAPPDQQ